MPWRVEKRDGKRPYKIINKDTGKVVGSSSSRQAARASVKARYANKPQARRKK